MIQKGTYACNYCNEKFARETSLKRHISTKHIRVNLGDEAKITNEKDFNVRDKLEQVPSI